MRTVLVVAVLVACGTSEAGPGSDAPGSGAIVDSVRASTTALLDAIRARDSARVLAYFADDSGVRAIEGGAMTRSDMAGMIGGFYRSMRSIEATVDGPLHVAALGPEVAVASGRYKDVFVDTTGARTEARGIATWLWSRRAGRWQIFHLHATPDPSPPGR